MSKGLTVGHRQKRYITSKPASYCDSGMPWQMNASAQYPLISKKLTGTGGEEDWIT